MTSDRPEPPVPSPRGSTVIRRSSPGRGPVDPGPSTRARLDAVLVARGLARSRGHARDLVAAGAVRLDGRAVTRPSTPVGPQARIDVEAGNAYVGRAAHKLVAALDAFGAAGLRVRGRRCLDVGASTGGFTQVLLEHGAVAVVAVDVGHGQLAPRIAADPRVVERSGVNVRDVGPADLDGPFDLVVGDLSFISLTLVWPAIAAQLGPGADAVLLIKPQFEVGRAGLAKNGVVRSSRQRLAAVGRVLDAARAAGLGPIDVRPSPLPGASGNREYLGWFGTGGAPILDADEQDALVRALDDPLSHPEDRATEDP